MADVIQQETFRAEKNSGLGTRGLFWFCHQHVGTWAFCFSARELGMLSSRETGKGLAGATGLPELNCLRFS